MPEGLTLSEQGLLSGTPKSPTDEAGAPFEVTASYLDAQGKQIYRILVEGVEFEATSIAAGWYFSCAYLMGPARAAFQVWTIFLMPFATMGGAAAVIAGAWIYSWYSRETEEKNLIA